MMIHIPILMLGLLLTTAVRAELPASLELAASKIPGVSTQRQLLISSLEEAMKIGVSGQDLQSLMRLADTQQYSIVSANNLVRELSEVKRDGLPTMLIRDKLLEGMAKKIQAEKILAVSSQWKNALKDSDKTIKGMESRGLRYGKSSEREALVSIGASLQQRYGAKDTLLKLETSSAKTAKESTDARRLIAAANLTEMLLLHKATQEQAIQLSMLSLKVGNKAEQISAQQRSIQDQMRQGVALADIITGMSRSFDGKTNVPFSAPELSIRGQQSQGAFPGGLTMPGGGLPTGPAMPGGSFPVGPAAPGGGFPMGPAAPGGAVPMGAVPGASMPTGPASPGGVFPTGGGRN